MTLPSVAVVALLTSVALAASASGQTQTPPPPDAQPAGKAAAPAGDGTNEANPGYPMQGGGIYKGPPGKGAVTHDDAQGYKRT